MSDELLINVVPGEIRAAIVSDGRLVELTVERRRRASRVGDVYLGRVERIVPGMNAAFVDVGAGRAGFLGLDAARDGGGADGLDEGQAVTVQVVKDAIGRKGMQLGRRIALPGRHLVYAPDQDRIALSRRIEDEAERARLEALMAGIARPGEGFILRTAAVGAAGDALAGDADSLRALWSDIEAARGEAHPPALLHGELDPVLRIVRDELTPAMAAVRIDGAEELAAARAFCARVMPGLADRLAPHVGNDPIFDRYGVEEEIARAGEPRLRLPSGGWIVIQQTEALTAIDVNSGSFTDAARPEDTAHHTNREAALEIARQIRLRNLGGLIVIDFIHMEDDAHWDEVLGRLEGEMTKDRTPARLIGRTAAGLVELTRRRRRESLLQALTEECDQCDGGGRMPTVDTVAGDILRELRREARVAGPGRFGVFACAEVIEALEGPWRAALDEWTGRLGRGVTLRRDDEYARDGFDIVVEPGGQE